MSSNPLVGAWRLVSLERRTADGEVTHPFGLDPVGYIVYSESGHVSVAFMSAGRPRFATEDSRGGTPDEKVRAYDTYISYSGRYEIRGNTVVHHVEVSLYPNWVGTDLERSFELSGNRLRLSTAPFLVSGRMRSAHLVWERV